MKAAFVTGLKETEIREIEKPVIRENEVLIRIRAVGICGSDLHLFLGVHAFRKPPVILGHELAGEICETGSAVTRFKVGDRVTVNPSISCGECPACRRGLTNICDSRMAPGTDKWIGCFSEYFPAREDIVYKIDDSISFPRAALTEPLSVSMHILTRAKHVNAKRIAIVGCGTIGLMTLYLAKRQGIEKVICSDPAEYNRQKALEFGADQAVNPLETDLTEAVGAFTGGEGVDLTIVTAGTAQILNEASAITRKGGEIAMVAMMTRPLSFYSYSIVYKEQTIFGSQIYKDEDFEEAFSIMSSDPSVERFITQRLPMTEVQKALEMLSEKKENIIKIILEW